MNKEERVTYEEFTIMFSNVPRMCYTLYDKAEDEIERLNNIINELEKTLKKLIKENEEGYEKYPANWEEKTSVSNTWLTCRDSYLCILNKIKELKGEDKDE